MYLYGADSYRRTKELRDNILLPYIKKYPEGIIERFYLGEEGTLERLENFIGSQSLFEKKKIGVIYEIDSEEKKHQAILKSALEDEGTTLVVVSEKKLPKVFDFLLKEPVKAYEFEPLTGAKFVNFLKKEVGSQKLTVNDSVISQVASLHDGDTWGAVTELYNIAYGSVSEKASTAPEFFPMIQAFKGSSQAGRIKALWYALETTEPAAVFNMLATLVSGGDKIKMADYDVAIKSGKLEYEEALLDFVI